MYGYIYKTTNLYNGKIYIGQHRNSKFNPDYYGSGIRLNNVIAKHGIENFCVEMLEPCETEEELNIKEQYWIAKLNSMDRNIGYNLMSGGYKIRGIKLSEQSKQSISSTLKEYFKTHDSPRKGVHLSEETKEKLRQVNIGKVVSEETRKKHSRPAWNKGTHLTEKQKNHLREINLGKRTITKRSHKIYQLSCDGKIINSFDTLKQASDSTGYSAICIRRVCEKVRPQSHGYIWRYDKPII